MPQRCAEVGKPAAGKGLLGLLRAFLEQAFTAGGAVGCTGQRPGAVGVRGCLSPLLPLPTPAVANKFSEVGARSVSIGARSTGGSPGGGYLGGGTPPTEELAVVSVEEAFIM